jgi:DNA-binding transcriptional regulator LsrR (DeoR family)
MSTKRDRSRSVAKGRALGDDDVVWAATQHHVYRQPIAKLAARLRVGPSYLRHRLFETRPAPEGGTGGSRPLWELKIVDLRNSHERREASGALRGKYGLKGAVVLRVPEEAWDGKEPARTTALVQVACEAAQYLDQELRRLTKPVLMVGQGYTTSLVARVIEPGERLRDLKVVAAVGVTGPRPSPTEANAIAAVLADAYRGTCVRMPISVFWPSGEAPALAQLPVLREPFRNLRDAQVALVGVGVCAKGSWLREAIRAHGLQEADVCPENYCGDITGFFFDSSLNAVTGPYCALGVGLEPLKQMVRQAKSVIAVNAVDERRVDALRAALAGGLINVLITDDHTAARLVA